MRRLIVDKNISVHSKAFLKSLGFELIETIELVNINNSTSSHPDMQFLKIGEKKALVAECAYSYYKTAISDFEIIGISDIGGKYPDDCKLNAVLYNNLFITTEHQYKGISDYINQRPIIVNQGYTKCSTCVLNDKAILSADAGVSLKCSKNGVRSYILSDDEIVLNGYKNGFWGGSTGLLDKTHLFFNGNIEVLTCYPELLEILKKEKIEPVYHKHIPLTDNGSILSIDF